MTLLRPDVAAVAPATWPRGLSRRHQKRREEFHGKPWRDLMAMYRIHVFHVYSMCFFLFFWLYCSWPFIHGDSTKVVPSITVEEFWMTQLIRKWWLPEMNWMICNIYIWLGLQGPIVIFVARWCLLLALPSAGACGEDEWGQKTSWDCLKTRYPHFIS